MSSRAELLVWGLKEGIFNPQSFIEERKFQSPMEIPSSIETVPNVFGLQDFLIKIWERTNSVSWPITSVKAADFIYDCMNDIPPPYELSPYNFALEYFKLGLVKTKPSSQKGWGGKSINILTQDQFLALASLVYLRIRYGGVASREDHRGIFILLAAFLDNSNPLKLQLRPESLY